MVGVSGHRDLDRADLPRLREAVAAFVRQLKQQLPDTELRLIVGMAEGADLLVAETAVAEGVNVEAVLPMALTHYASDFDPATLAQLHALLAHPRVSCDELCTPAGEHELAEPHPPEVRDAMYANLTETLIRRSSLLLALWDGRVSQLRGGTADTVLRYLGVRDDGNPGPETLEFVPAAEQDELGERIVYWMPAARSGASTADGPRPPCFVRGSGDSTLQVQATMPGVLQRQLAQLNGYNREFCELIAAGRLPRPNSLVSDLPAALPLPDRRLLEHIDTQYGKADALAVYFQRRSDPIFHLFGFMAFVMGLAYLSYEKLNASRVLLIAYVVALFSSLGLYYVLKGKHWFSKHLTYRALAETLRARFYLRLAGADRSVDAEEVLALSGIERFRGFGWIAFVLKGIEPPNGATGLHALDAREVSSLEQVWIDSQFGYFTRKVKALERSSRRMKLVRRSIFAAILLAIAVLFTFGDTLHKIDMGTGVPIRNVLTFAMGVLAVLLGVWELHQDKMATRELLWQYRNQLSHFSRARTLLARLTSPVRRNNVLAELGRDSLMESYLWAIHRYHREHEPPSTGAGS